MSIYRVDNRVIDFRGPRSWVITPPPSGGTPVGGLSVDIYSMYHSLHNHSYPSSDQHEGTRVANWVHLFGVQAPNGGNAQTIAALFDLRDTSRLNPPQAGATHEHAVNSPYFSLFEAATWVGKQNIDVVQMLPDNFESWNYDPDAQSNWPGPPITTHLRARIDEWEANAPSPSRRYSIYTSWPNLDRAGNTGDDPANVTPTIRANWISLALGDYQAWWDLLLTRLRSTHPTVDIRLHNINRAVALTWRDTPVVDIPPTELFEDNVHGRSTLYCIAAIAEYIELYNEKPPANFVFPATMQADPARRVHALLVDNFPAVVDYIWGVLRP